MFTIIKSDFIRYNQKSFLKSYFLIPGFKYTFYIRIAQYFSTKKILKPLHLLTLIKIICLQHRYGIQIPWSTKIGKGFYIGHFGTIVVSGCSIIGNNVNISQGVTIGMANRGKNRGYPIIGDRVYIGPGVKIVGGVKIGNDVAIGANAVITHDVPDNACVAGVPAKIISMNGSKGYVNNLAD